MQFVIRLIFILLLSFIFQSCSKKPEKSSLIQEVNQEEEMISAYREGIKALDEGDAFFAAKKFLEAELLLPQSEWAPKTALMASYSYYIQDYYTEAIFNLERFIKTYPKDNRMDYVHYLLAICYYENIENEKRDLQQLISAKKQFDIVVNNYPSTDFALDAKFKIDLINEVMASKEMYLGKHYLKKEKWIPAINRFKHIIKYYDTTIFSEEAIHRLVEIHYRIGLEAEAKNYANLLGYNYLSSEWYKKSYKIFNKEYKTQKIKKEKKGIKEKFKKIFQ
ncbi:outer membrane protein assembly factor BamD [Pelagibacteraceae bacterium]|nr:outer membrane protein assembly factor BamD [Pelagibacteraceae bacterium]